MFTKHRRAFHLIHRALRSVVIAVAICSTSQAQVRPSSITVTQVLIPEFPGASAIWGATGRDSRGHVWFGVSTEGGEGSACLFEYDPASGVVTNRGDVISMLKQLRLYRPGEAQAKIHSKIWELGDSLYFSSSDDTGEHSDGSAPGRWGSHLWRLRLSGFLWEHLLAVPEGLTAVAVAEPWVYALGLWNHVLYQYDTRTGHVRRKAVGAVGGHMSRNFVADRRGHVYVPRVQVAKRKSTREDPFGLSGLKTTLVEFDTALEQVGETVLRGYADPRNPSLSHGIIGFTHLEEGSIAIAVHTGTLYRIRPKNDAPAIVEELGAFHPLGSAYTPSLFTTAKESMLAGVALPPRGGHVWLMRQLNHNSSQPVVAFPFRAQDLLLYGSETRDDSGHFYVGGRYTDSNSGAGRPVLLRIEQH